MQIKNFLFATVSFVVFAAGASVAEPFRLVITDLEPPLVPNSVVDIAQAGGYFERAGVDVEILRVQQTPMAIAALQSGEGDMANVATESLVQLVAQGAKDLRAVTSPNKALPYLIAGKEGMTLDGLKGQSFGIGRVGSLDQTLSTKVLADKGVDVAGLEMVALGQPNIRAQALAAGQVGATTMSIGSYLALPGHEKLPVLVGVEDYYKAAPVVSKVNAVKTATLEKRGPEVEAVIEALTLAARDMAKDKDAWAKAMAPLRPDVDAATLDTLGAAFQTSWSVNGGIQKDELAYTQDWLYQSDEFKGLAKVELTDWVDFGPADKVLAKIGAVEGADKVSR
ncbi:ABC transporter substrate-binding protein [Paracoccus aminophilus]|uniref:ABC-type nitrate/sulfonate/bicarbonate transport systems n=1 Tax=Paracoccus aminophilus JCM 7686 TaxID=1367847 RepID=S5YIB0_PARAH|nr:ABC transporter substrate-binding protein [Paracoccus aminophilus]AGT11213.1 ABC-type nitrate/sulfonate/bicarbonate transport systems [Paracoccus aminophilus JCM 7686]